MTLLKFLNNLLSPSESRLLFYSSLYPKSKIFWHQFLKNLFTKNFHFHIKKHLHYIVKLPVSWFFNFVLLSLLNKHYFRFVFYVYNPSYFSVSTKKSNFRSFRNTFCHKFYPFFIILSFQYWRLFLAYKSISFPSRHPAS